MPPKAKLSSPKVKVTTPKAKVSGASAKKGSAGKKSASPKKKKKSLVLAKEAFDSSCLDVLLPTSSSAGECSILIQIEPQDAELLDFEGAAGAIGRFEAEEHCVTLDLKGYQYQGSIHSGPTALVLAVGKGGQLKVDAISDEFVALQKTQDVMANMDGVVVQGIMDQGYQVVEEDVNAREKRDHNTKKAASVENSSSGKKKRAASTSAPQFSKRRKKIPSKNA